MNQQTLIAKQTKPYAGKLHHAAAVIEELGVEPYDSGSLRYQISAAEFKRAFAERRIREVPSSSGIHLECTYEGVLFVAWEEIASEPRFVTLPPIEQEQPACG